MLGVAPATLRDWKCQRIGPAFVQYGPHCVRYLESDLHKFIASKRVVPYVREVGRKRRAPVQTTSQSVLLLRRAN